MSEPDPHRAFLLAIATTPDDDLPRLVYADFLDEIGDTERAEFVRLQCEITRLDMGDRQLPMGVGREKLLAREKELLDAHHADWLKGLPPGECHVE